MEIQEDLHKQIATVNYLIEEALDTLGNCVLLFVAFMFALMMVLATTYVAIPYVFGDFTSIIAGVATLIVFLATCGEAIFEVIALVASKIRITRRYRKTIGDKHDKR